MTAPGPNLVGGAGGPGIAVSTRSIGSAVVLSVEGQVTTATAPRFAAAAIAALEYAPGLLIIDLTAVTFLCTAGLSILVEADSRTTEGFEGRIVSGADSSRAITATGLQYLLQVFGSVEAAVGTPGTDHA